MTIKNNKKYYKLDLSRLPDSLFDKKVPVAKWLEHTTATDSNKKFEANSLNKVTPIPLDVEIERIFGIALYMVGNVLPFTLPGLTIAAYFSDVALICLLAFLLYFAVLFVVSNYYFRPKFVGRYQRKNYLSETDIRDNQYLYTERNNQKYMSLNFIWPETIQRPALDDKPVIFCAIPHGAAPLGITAYPIWSKLFNDKLCHWTCAPIVLKLPVISYYMRKIGYIEAKAKKILDTLTKKEENVGIILDGIAGMFQSHDEIAHIRSRKGIVKIALRAGIPIVPVYGFGHTAMWKVIVDPFGLLEYLSVKLEVSLTPFFGRFFWFIGPPKRVAICMCMGEPVMCPKIEQPTQEDIDKYHKQLLDNYEELFEQHKDAYGWGHKKLKFV